jgi:hypothetical protein
MRLICGFARPTFAGEKLSAIPGIIVTAGIVAFCILFVPKFKFKLMVILQLKIDRIK